MNNVECVDIIDLPNYEETARKTGVPEWMFEVVVDGRPVTISRAETVPEAYRDFHSAEKGSEEEYAAYQRLLSLSLSLDVLSSVCPIEPRLRPKGLLLELIDFHSKK